jgi:hypothetical protein
MSEDVKQDPVKVDDVKQTTEQPEVVKSVSESVPYSRFADTKPC